MRALFRSFLFRFRDYDFARIRPGFGVTSVGRLAQMESEDSIRQAILMLLSTVPGERVMRPTYGCSLRSLVFSPNDDTTAGLAAHYVLRALTRWEPRIALERVDAGRDPENPERLRITVDYRVRQSGFSDSMTYLFHLGGAT